MKTPRGALRNNTTGLTSLLVQILRGATCHAYTGGGKERGSDVAAPSVIGAQDIQSEGFVHEVMLVELGGERHDPLLLQAV